MMLFAADQFEPLQHLQIVRYVELSVFGIDISITNSVVWMWVAVACVFLFFVVALRQPSVVPGRLQMLAELCYLFVLRMVENNIHREGHRFLPLVFTIFYFVLFCNLVGLLPGGFTPTSQLVVTCTLALAVFVFTILIRIIRHGWGFLHAFAPSGVPWVLLPLMVPIEIISFIARPISLAVRLFANMTAGHTVLAVIAFFGLSMPILVAWLPMGFSVVFTGMEVFIAVIQGYIFSILSCVYIDDALEEG